MSGMFPNVSSQRCEFLTLVLRSVPILIKWVINIVFRSTLLVNIPMSLTSPKTNSWSPLQMFLRCKYDSDFLPFPSLLCTISVSQVVLVSGPFTFMCRTSPLSSTRTQQSRLPYIRPPILYSLFPGTEESLRWVNQEESKVPPRRDCWGSPSPGSTLECKGGRGSSEENWSRDIGKCRSVFFGIRKNKMKPETARP